MFIRDYGHKGMKIMIKLKAEHTKKINVITASYSGAS